MKNPLIIMSAITGKPTKNDIQVYLKGLKDNGIEQIMLYPRSGCEIEYLSESWFDTIGNFIQLASKLDMCIWLYDDFNWPSGDACGRVTSIPEYRLRAIMTIGENMGEVSYKSRHNSDLFGEKFFPNLLSYDAVDYFIKCTHEEYFKRFSKYFGTTIKGIFTDEPSIGYCCQDGAIPYYDGIEKDYFDFCSRSFNEDMCSQNEDFYLNATSVISNRFNSCYISRIASWCKEHRILMTGHLMCDNEPFWTARHNGRFLKNLSSFSLPGIDEIETSLDNRTEMALFGAIEYARGENGAMAELFALGPCDMSFAKKRLMLYLSACHKIDNYFLAISHLDMRGNMLVTDFFNNFNTDQPDFCGMRILANEAKNAYLYAQKDFKADVYIRYPYTASARNITKNLDLTCLFDLINELTYKHIQWKFVDDEVNLDAPVIELNDNLEFTINGNILDLSLLKGKFCVKDRNGDTPRGIFIRKFNDGSIIVLNLFAPSGEYFINGKSVYLGKDDVVFSLEEKSYKKQELLCTFDISYKNDNMIRAMYINDTESAILNCENDTNIIFAIRKDTEAYLDDCLIACHNDSSILSDGMKNLYKISHTVSLKAGKHIIKAKKDFKYLPSVFIIGDFSYSIENSDICAVNLSKRVNKYCCGDFIYDYGKIELLTTITIPQGAKFIELEGTQLYTLAYCDNILLGEKIASPYIFEIDKDLWGKSVELKIVQYTSMGNIFGDVAFWDKVSLKSQWRGTPSTHKSNFGFDRINFIYGAN